MAKTFQPWDPASHKLILGDFNLPEIDSSKYGIVNASKNQHSARLVESMRDAFLFQHVELPSCFHLGQEPSTLNLILTNEENMVQESNSRAGLGKSDHIVISFKFMCYADFRCEGSSTSLNMTREIMKL